MSILLAFSVSYLVGSLPLGSWLVERSTGVRAKDLSAHNLGVENLFRFVGAPVALASFFIDILKGFLVLALFVGNPWAALGVYLGHLYPLANLVRDDLPRGRGNGIVIGILAGLGAYAGVPLAVVAVPVFIYAALLAWTNYVALATVAGLVSLPLLLLAFGYPLESWLPTALLVFLGVWRHKVNLVRMVDGTETRLGDPPPVRGMDPGVVTAAFMVHPMTVDDIWQPGSMRWLAPMVRRGVVPANWVRYIARYARPFKAGEVRDIDLADGRELRVILIGGTMFPEQIRSYEDDATALATAGAKLARELGAEAFGLGAFWSTVGNKGLDVQAAVPDLHITNGGAYTAGTVKAAIPELLKHFEEEGRNLRRARAAVVGANGVVAFGVARTLAAEVGELILVGRDAERLERSAATLRRKYPQVDIRCSTDISQCVEADLIITATSDPNPVIFAEHVKPGTWIFDIGRPADVDASVREVPGVKVIPGGMVRPPGSMVSQIDLHFGDGMIPACMAETMIMTATRAFDRKSLGAQTKSANIDFYLLEGERLGFEIITRDDSAPVLSEVA